MNQHDPLEQRLIRTFNHVADTSSFGDDWDRIRSDLDLDGSGSDHSRPWRAVAAIGVAALVIGIGVLAWTSRFPGESEALGCDLAPIEQIRQLVPQVDQAPPEGLVLPGETILDRYPLIVAAAPGPAPEFDTGALGDEVEVAPIGELTTREQALVFGDTQPVGAPDGVERKRTVLGRIGGTIWLSRILDTPAAGTTDFVERLRSLEGAGTSGGWSQSADPDGLDAIVVPSIHESPEWTGVLSGPVNTPGLSETDGTASVAWDGVRPEAAVVTLETGDIRLWVQPTGGVAVFPINAFIDNNQEYRLRQYSTSGVEIACWTDVTPEDDQFSMFVDLAAIPTHTIDGTTQPLSDVVASRPVLIVVATSNSAPTVDDQSQIDQLTTIADAAGQTDLPIIVVAAFDRAPELLQQRVAEAGITGPVIVLDNDSDASLLKVGALPSVVLIDENGEVQIVLRDRLTENDLLDAIDLAFD